MVAANMKTGAFRGSQDKRQTRRSLVVIAAIAFLIMMLVTVKHWYFLDAPIEGAFNQIRHHNAVADSLIFALTRDFFSGAVVCALIVFGWFKFLTIDVRSRLLVGLVAAFCSGILSRALQKALPTHLRPIHDTQFDFKLPYGMDASWLNHWSSFPSDHAAVLFGLAFVLWTVDRRLGTIGLVVAAAVNIARMYLGYHWLTDVVGGGALGIVVVALALPLRTSRIVQSLMSFEPARAPYFYAVSFLILFGVSTLFNDVRSTLSDAVGQYRLQHMR